MIAAKELKVGAKPSVISAFDPDDLSVSVLSALGIENTWSDYHVENFDFVTDVLEECSEYCELEKEDFDNGQPGGFGWEFTFTVFDAVGAKSEICALIAALR